LGQISQYTVVAGQTTSLRFDGGSRTVIRVDGNAVRIAYRRDAFSQNEFFTIKDGEAFVFDPNPLTGTTAVELGYVIYATVNTGANATVQVWLQGQTQGAY
jgi:hypothetical protein